MQNVYIVAASRTAIGSLNKSLSTFKPYEIGAMVIKDVLEKANIKSELVGETIIGNIIQTERKGNPARQAILKAGFPIDKTAFTINYNCGSSNKAINLGAMMIKAEEKDIVIAGGMEVMSMAPYILKNARKGYRMGNNTLSDLLTDLLFGMGETAENIAVKYNISRREQDEFALISQKRVYKAQENNYFYNQILPIEIVDRKKNVKIFNKDEGNRKDTSIESLLKLPSAFIKNGTVTAGNSSMINDAASVLLLMSEKAVKKYNVKPLARIVSWASAGVDPDYMGLGPIEATKLVLKKTDMKIDDIDLIELNEAFASQSIACMRDLEMDIEKTNVNGGAIALGHPVGATGAILFTKLVHELIRRKSKYGLVTLCIGGGQGISTIIENVY